MHPQNKIPKNLEQYDSNFMLGSDSKDLLWIDSFDNRLSIGGLAWIKENRNNKNLRRLPDRAASLLPEAVAELSYCPAGVYISFITDSPCISVRIQVADTTPMMHMPATGMAGAELLCRSADTWYPVATVVPSPDETFFRRDVFEGGDPSAKEFRLYLPLYKKVEKVEIGVSRQSNISATPTPKEKPLFFYGTSITQGGCANTAASDYVSTIGRLLDTEVINFGFSGSGRGEPSVARLIAEVDAQMFVLDHLANAPLEDLCERLANFVSILRASHPLTPILILGMPGYNKLIWNKQTQGIIQNKSQIALNIYSYVRSKGDNNIHFIDGRELLPPGIIGAYVDGVHPTSHGFAIIAERLAPRLRTILKKTDLNICNA